MKTECDHYLTDIIQGKIRDAEREFCCFTECIEDQNDITERKEYSPYSVRDSECIRNCQSVAEGNAGHYDHSAKIEYAEYLVSDVHFHRFENIGKQNSCDQRTDDCRYHKTIA